MKVNSKTINPVNLAENPYAPNKPVGKAQGLIPGRVSWVWNPQLQILIVQTNLYRKILLILNMTHGSWRGTPARRWLTNADSRPLFNDR